MLKLCLGLLIASCILPSWAGSKKCSVTIENVNSGEKYSFEETFVYTQHANAQRKHFKLSNDISTCTLVFFDDKSGTMLSCLLDEAGDQFIQSDRSIIKESLQVNNLSFRYKESFYSIESKCE